MLKIRPSLIDLRPYSTEEAIWDIKLDANERAGGLPSEVQAELTTVLTQVPVHRYPDMAMLELRTQIADEFGLTADNVLLGSGSSELLQAICYTFGGAGSTIVFPSPSFSMYGIYVRTADSKPEPVLLDAEYGLTSAQVLAAAQKNTASLVMLCNPNNPTGGVMPIADIEAIVAGADCPVVVDEAYFEYYGHSAVGLLPKYRNLIIARTFSKAYGLAGARVGYMLADAEITAAVNKILMPYHVNSLSLAVANVVYRNRQKFLGGIKETVAERQRLATALQALPGVRVYPSEANFLLFQVDNAGVLNCLLASRGIGIRDFSQVPNLHNCLRVTIGISAENDSFLQTVQDFVNENIAKCTMGNE